MPTPDPYNPAVNANFRAALVAYWLTTPGLTAISPGPYADEAAVRREPPYCVLSDMGSRIGGRGSKKTSYWEDTLYQFAIYHHNPDVAVSLGESMIALLDPIEDWPLRFANGYQRSWMRLDPRLMEVPEVMKAGARTIWQQVHTYRVSVGKTRIASVP